MEINPIIILWVCTAIVAVLLVGLGILVIVGIVKDKKEKQPEPEVRE